MLTLLFVPPDVQTLELAGPMDALFEANQRLAPEQRYRVHTVAASAGPLRCASGLPIIIDSGIADAPYPPDTLIVLGSFGIPQDPPEPVLAWLRRNASASRRYGGLCTGTFILGVAGLIDGHRVTTHWQFAEILAARFPAAQVDPDPIFIRDRALFTSAGSSAGIDLALALIEEDHGRDLALWVARRLVVFLKRLSGQSQLSVQLTAQAAARSPVEKVVQMVRDNPANAFTLVRMARLAAMSPRNFSRVFRRETGMSPADFVEQTRVELARRLLESREGSVQQIIIQSGFGSPAAGRRAFLRRLGLTPSEYRGSRPPGPMPSTN